MRTDTVLKPLSIFDSNALQAKRALNIYLLICLYWKNFIHMKCCCCSSPTSRLVSNPAVEDHGNHHGGNLWRQQLISVLSEWNWDTSINPYKWKHNFAISLHSLLTVAKAYRAVLQRRPVWECTSRAVIPRATAAMIREFSCSSSSILSKQPTTAWNPNNRL